MNKKKAVLSELVLGRKDGIGAMKLVIILRTNGCSYAKRTGGCSFCSLIDNSDKNVTTDDLICQFNSEIVKYNPDDYQHIELLTLGSYFDEKEMPSQAFEDILKAMGNMKNVKSVLLESRPEFITHDGIKKALACLNGKSLEIGLGIESTVDYVRKGLKKGYTLQDAGEVLKMFGKYNVGLLAYVLHKPLGLSEYEAIQNSIETIDTIFSWENRYGIQARAALQPFYIPRGSCAHEQYIKGEYYPPSLWSVIEVLKAINHLGDITVSLNDEGLADGLVAMGCESCDSTIRAALEQFNDTNELDELIVIQCECKRQWEVDTFGKESV